MELQICPKKTALNILEQIQILYQNNEVDAKMKNEMTALTQKGMTTGDFSELHTYVKSRRSGFTFGDVILEILRMTN